MENETQAKETNESSESKQSVFDPPPGSAPVTSQAKDGLPSPDQLLAERQMAVASIIQKHFASQPDAVLIVSARGTTVMHNATGFIDPGVLCLAGKISEKTINEMFDSFLIDARKKAQSTTPPGESL